MPAFKDLTGQRIGSFIVLRRADEPYISPQGVPTIRWVVQCAKCGHEITLLRGDIYKRQSCGCDSGRHRVGAKNMKTCQVCGKQFAAPPTGNKFCSRECCSRHMSAQRMGKKRPDVKPPFTAATRKAAKENVKIATAAAAENPLNQRGAQNRASKVWILIDPNGCEHRIVNLWQWARENYALFDPGTDDAERTAHNIRSGFSAIVSSANGAPSRKQRPVSSYKGWYLRTSHPKTAEDQNAAMQEYHLRHNADK